MVLAVGRDGVDSPKRGLGGGHDFRVERVAGPVRAEDPLAEARGHVAPEPSAVAAAERHPRQKRDRRAPVAEQRRGDVVAGVGQGPALDGQEGGDARGVVPRAVRVAVRKGVSEPAGVAQGLEAEPAGPARPQMPGKTKGACPAGILRREGAGEVRQEPDLEPGVVGDQDMRLEGADRGGQGGEGLGQAGLARDVPPLSGDAPPKRPRGCRTGGRRGWSRAAGRVRAGPWPDRRW